MKFVVSTVGRVRVEVLYFAFFKAICAKMRSRLYFFRLRGKISVSQAARFNPGRKGGNAVKVTVFGDSIGKGVFTDGGKIEVLKENAVSLFEQWRGVKVDNKSGYGQSLKRTYEKGVIDRYIQSLDKTEENIAVLELGGNDADFDWKEVALSPEEAHFPKTRIEEFSGIYSEILKKLTAAGVRAIACTIVPISSERYFENVIGKACDPEKVLEFFKGDVNTIHRHQEMFNNEILKNSYRAGVDVIDLRKQFLDTNEFESLICRDGIHPNATGHERIFEAVKAFAS